jgi:serine/threonine protein kinase
MAFTLSDYKDIKEIAKGGMSILYSAIQISLNRKVVIKKMASHLADEKSYIIRFENEAKAAATLEHDNIIRIYDYGAEQGAFYIVMEYIDGFGLDHLLKTFVFMKEACLMIMLQALKGLDFAHKQNVLHRDIKPGNIFVSKDGRVKVLDFGLAWTGEPTDLTATESVIGTPVYLSPERARGGREKDIRSDIFSVGVLLYRIISGELPFKGENVPAIMHEIVYTKEKDIRIYDPTLPDDLVQQLSLCLNKNLEERLPNLKSLIISLQNYLFDMGIRDITDDIAKVINLDPTGMQDMVKRITGYHIRKGKDCVKSGQLEKAKAHFKEGIKKDPKNKEIQEIIMKVDGLKMTPLPLPVLKVVAKASPRFKRALLPASVIILLVFLTGIFILKQRREIPKTDMEQKESRVKDREPSAGSGKIKKKSGSKLDWGRVIVTVAPHDAEVFVDNHKMTPNEMLSGKKLETGQHSIRARAAGYKGYHTYIMIEKDTRRNLSIAMKPAGKETGSLHIYAEPWAEVYVDGERMGIAPTPKPLVLSQGKHVLILKRQGLKNHEQIITINKDQKTRVRVEMKKSDAE